MIEALLASRRRFRPAADAELENVVGSWPEPPHTGWSRGANSRELVKEITSDQDVPLSGRGRPSVGLPATESAH
jgi:hypothetical protein